MDISALLDTMCYDRDGVPKPALHDVKQPSRRSTFSAKLTAWATRIVPRNARPNYRRLAELFRKTAPSPADHERLIDWLLIEYPRAYTAAEARRQEDEWERAQRDQFY